MGKKEVYTQKAIFVTKCMLAAYILTAGLLLLLAFMLYRFGLPEKAVSLCIIGIYIAVTFLTGVLSGKRAGRRKYLWGLLMGSAYFLVLAGVSMVLGEPAGHLGDSTVTTLVLCAAGGMLGGMVS